MVSAEKTDRTKEAVSVNVVRTRTGEGACRENWEGADRLEAKRNTPLHKRGNAARLSISIPVANKLTKKKHPKPKQLTALQ